MFRRGERMEIKTDNQLACMRAAGLVVADALDAVRAHLRPGVTTGQLDAVAADVITNAGATASFLGYHGFPATICVSVNDEVVHGIPGPRLLREGDLVSVDCGAIVDGWHGDAAFTAPVGEVDDDQQRLVAATEDALWAGLAHAVVGNRVGDVSSAVESTVRMLGPYGVIEEYVGHGIGSAMHMDPAVPNVGRPRQGPHLLAGMAIAVEPMVTMGTRHTNVLDDEWTVVTADGSRAAHVEHTVAITAEGPWVLTARDGGRLRLGTELRG